MEIGGTHLVLAAFFVSLAYVFGKTVQRGLVEAMIAVMVLADIYALFLMLLGIDRPWIMVCTRLGCITITYLQAFLLAKLPLTIYTMLKKKQLKQTLEH